MSIKQTYKDPERLILSNKLKLFNTNLIALYIKIRKILLVKYIRLFSLILYYFITENIKYSYSFIFKG